MATKGKKILEKRILKIARFRPGDKKTFYQTYELRFHNELTVLDALNHIKDEQDGTLTYRYSCRMGICGSCSAVVNGKPVLMCQTNLRDIKGEIQVEPLRNFPIIKDLVVDLKDTFEKMRSVNAHIHRTEEKVLEDGEYIQTPSERNALEQPSQCIKCMLCYSACSVYGLDKNFVGPGAGALAMRYQSDTRDQGKNERLDKLINRDGVWKCSFIGECSNVCPKRVNPALAMQKFKLLGALRLGKKIISKS